MGAGLRELKKEHTREALVRSALRQFAKRGFDGVTIEEIAATCRVSPRTFFRYFSSKEDVLFSDGDRRSNELLQVLEAEPIETSPLDALQNAARTLAGYYEDHRDEALLRRRIVDATPALRTRLAERTLSWESDALELLRASGRAGAMSELDLRLLVGSVTTALRVAVDLWVVADSGPTLSELFDLAIERLRSGVGNAS